MIIIERKTIGKNIKRLREQAGLTQEELAEKVYKNQDYISKIENGKSGKVVDLEAINDIAVALNCDVDTILKQRRKTMLKSIDKPQAKFFEAPEPWNSMSFYYEFIEENVDDSKMLSVWICRENVGIKEYLMGLPYKQPDKIYTYEETFKIAEANLTDVNGYYNVKNYCEEYCPEDIEKVYKLAANYNLLNEDEDNNNGCPYCNVNNV